MTNQDFNSKNNGIRLAKYIATAGYCSRRQAEELINQGKVKVNNIVVNTPVYFVSKTDSVTVAGKAVELKKSKPKLYAYYKPVNTICSYKDEEDRDTIFKFIPKELGKLVYIGRLDYKSEGLLLLTNNGNLSNIISSPKLALKRVYKVRVFGKVNQNELDNLAHGVTIDNVKYKPIIANLIKQVGSNAWVEFTLTEGKNKEIRRVCEYLNLQVSRLIRTNFGNYKLGDMQPNEIIEVNIEKKFL